MLYNIIDDYYNNYLLYTINPAVEMKMVIRIARTLMKLIGDMTMLTKHTIYPTVPAKDLPRARKFYEEKLGYKPDRVSPDGIFYKSDGCTSFLLYETPSAGTAQHTLLSWETTHLVEDMKDLRSRGIKFEEYDMPGLKTQDGVATTNDGMKAAWFKDSEGNILGIAQM